MYGKFDVKRLIHFLNNVNIPLGGWEGTDIVTDSRSMADFRIQIM